VFAPPHHWVETPVMVNSVPANHRGEFSGISFVLHDLPLRPSGIEIATVESGRLVLEKLGVPFQLLTLKFNPRLPEGLRACLTEGASEPLPRVVNFFETLESSSLKQRDSSLLFPDSWEFLQTLEERKVAGTKSSKFFARGSSELSAYQVVPLGQDAPSHINFFRHGIIVARDTLDAVGNLARRRILSEDKQRVLSIFFSRSGTAYAFSIEEVSGLDKILAAAEVMYFPTNQGLPTAIVSDLSAPHFRSAVDAMSFIETNFERLSLEQAHSLFIQETVQPLCSDPHLIVSAKNRLTFMPSLEAHRNIRRSMDSMKTLSHLVAAIHSNHRVSPNLINRHYTQVFSTSPKDFDGVIVLTPNQKKDIEESFPDLRATFIPHASRIGMRRTAGLSSKKVALVGRLAAGKNQIRAVTLFNKVRLEVPDASLHFFGTGPMEEEIRGHIRDCGLEESVHLEGWVSDMESALLGFRALI